MLNRDSVTWWLILFGALVGYLVSIGVPFWEWTYTQWLQFLAAFIPWLIGYMQKSPLAGEATPMRDSSIALGGLIKIYDKKE